MISDNTHHAPLSGMSPASPYQDAHEERSAQFSGKPHPIIGIPIAVSQSHQGPLLCADAAGAWAIERMHGRVFLIPLWPFPTHAHRYQSLWPLMQSMDGLFLPAGPPGTDWYTQWMERESQPGPQTWTLSWEIALAQLASCIGMPILAVADGAEKWNVALGGRGRQRPPDGSSDGPVPLENWGRQTIRVRAKSTLAASLLPALTPSEQEPHPWKLAFMPQQGVETVAPGLRPCAQSEETAVVAFERKDTVFGLGIVGRLDWGLDQVYGTALFEAFLQASQSFALARQHNMAWESSRDMVCATLSQRVMQGQPLLPVPAATHEETDQRISRRSGSLAVSTPSSNGSTGQQERFRQRSHPPTKEELNTIRRQRLKATFR